MDVDNRHEVETIKFTDDADLILYSNPQYLNQVSLKVLSAASPVFKAMFAPGFAEGQKLLESTGSSLPMIQLPDDDETAIEWLCWILHHHNLDRMVDEMFPNLIQALAIIADKYQCIAAVAPLSSSMFQGLDLEWTPESCANPNYREDIGLRNSEFINAAYLLDDAEYFQKYTDFLVKHNSYFHIVVNYTRGLENLHENLDKRDDECKDYLYEKIASVAESIAKHLQRTHKVKDRGMKMTKEEWAKKCDYQQRVAGRYLEQLVKMKVWPVGNESPGILKDLLEVIKRLGHPNTGGLEPCKQRSGCDSSWGRRIIDPEIKSLKKCADDIWAGLCLDCFKANEEDEAVCRIPHSQCSLMRDEANVEEQQAKTETT